MPAWQHYQWEKRGFSVLPLACLWHGSDAAGPGTGPPRKGAVHKPGGSETQRGGFVIQLRPRFISTTEASLPCLSRGKGTALPASCTHPEGWWLHASW